MTAWAYAVSPERVRCRRRARSTRPAACCVDLIRLEDVDAEYATGSQLEVHIQELDLVDRRSRRCRWDRSSRSESRSRRPTSDRQRRQRLHGAGAATREKGPKVFRDWVPLRKTAAVV